MPSTSPTPDFADLDAVRKVVDALVTFDPEQQKRILRWAREKLELPADAPPVSQYGVPEQTLAPRASQEGGEPSRTMDIKTFIESKNPSSDNQFAAAVAYFYRFEAPDHLRKEAITKDDLLEACRQVGRNRISRPDQTLVNAHGQGLLDRAEKGAYSINTVGENLVAVALPSDGGGRAVARGGGKKKPGRRRVATKGAAKRRTSSAKTRR